MTSIEVNIRFMFQGTVYLQKKGMIPRHQAIKIPQLRVEQLQSRTAMTKKSEQKHSSYNNKSANKNNNNSNNKNSSDGKNQQQFQQEYQEIQGQENDENEMDMEEGENVQDGEAQVQGEGEDGDQEQQDQNQQEVEEQDMRNLQYDQDMQQEQQSIQDQSNEDNDLSQISRSISPNMIYGKSKTKRQKGQLDNFLQLPLKKPRKDAKKFDQATQILRKQQKQKKRKQYIKKLMQAQEKATFDKILNETGRKFRQRQQRQMKQVRQKNGRLYKNLGDVPKVITKQTAKGTHIYTHKTNLFSPEMMHEPNVRMSQQCSVCHSEVGKYKTSLGIRFCSVACFKKIQEKENKVELKI